MRGPAGIPRGRVRILVGLVCTALAAGAAAAAPDPDRDARVVIAKRDAKGEKPAKGPPWQRGASRSRLPEIQIPIPTPSGDAPAPVPEAPSATAPAEARTPTAPQARARAPAQPAAPAPAPPTAPPTARTRRVPAAAGALALLALAGAALARARRAPIRAAPAGAPTLVEPVAAPAPARAPRVFGADDRYEVLERIGAGGMGVVYRARDLRLGREVALKRLSEQLADHPKAVGYFLREARAVAALCHRNVVTLYDVDEDDGVPFLTMELLQGYNLSQMVASRGPFSSADTARVGVQAAAGLACAHAQGIVHRDVKGSNLFLTRERVIKVMDFGLAQVAAELRRSGTVVGTPQYMAPEQAGGREVDHRADLYALGVTLFHLATARFPFEAGDLPQQHRHAPPPDPRALRPELAPALAELILACLAKEPDKRPATAEELSRRLREVIAA
jgi:hypothetical protein